MKRVLVTGATGFCGQYLVAHLVQRDYRVIGTFHPKINKSPKISLRNPSYSALDITDYAGVCRIIRAVKPDFIYHLAAQSVSRDSDKRAGETFSVNAGGTLNLLNALRQEKTVCRFVYISSSQVYGKTFDAHPQVSEKHMPRPTNTYSFSKYLGELACLDFYRRFGLDIVIARPFNHFGAGQSGQFVFSEWSRQIAQIEAGRIKPVLRVGNTKVKRDFLHVRDVVTAYEKIAIHGKSGCLYNIATGKAKPLSEYLDFLLRQTRLRITVKADRALFRSHDLPVTSGDSKRLGKLGWKARETAFVALSELLADWRNRVKTQAAVS